MSEFVNLAMIDEAVAMPLHAKTKHQPKIGLILGFGSWRFG